MSTAQAAVVKKAPVKYSRETGGISMYLQACMWRAKLLLDTAVGSAKGYKLAPRAVLVTSSNSLARESTKSLNQHHNVPLHEARANTSIMHGPHSTATKVHGHGSVYLYNEAMKQT